MLHKLLTIGLPLLLPCLIYFSYAYFAHKRAVARGEGDVDAGPWQRVPWGILLACSLALMVAALVYVRLHSGVEPGTKMEPPRLIDGEVQPSRVAE